MPGFPVVPLAFMLAALYVVIGSIVSNPGNAVKGTVLILLGWPVFLFWKGRAEKGKNNVSGKRTA
jgi:APA family basic amino acid/polyamine antiporter